MTATSLFFFQAEDGIRYLVRSRGLGDVYKRQAKTRVKHIDTTGIRSPMGDIVIVKALDAGEMEVACLLYTSDAADERSSVDLGGRRIIKKKNDVATSDGSGIER